MSLTSAVQAAVSGLGASARRAETVASNVANASTPGYARRNLDLVSHTAAPGVRILDTQRQVDRLVLSETRLSNAELGQRELLSGHAIRVEAAIGAAGDGDSVAGAIHRLQAALTTAAGDPSTETRLAEVADAASALTNRFARASDGLQSVRVEVDRSIAADVDALNTGLSRVAELDHRILVTKASGRDTSSLQDLKQREIDAISRIVPLRESVRSDGRSILSTLSGTVLLNGRASELSFEATPGLSPINPQGKVIQVDGKPALASEGGTLAGGTLSAAFELRDRIVPQVQQDLDALAADLIQRLASADPTLSVSDAGILADGARPLDPSSIAGLSSRMELNRAVDRDNGGSLWRLRSGIGATDAGPSGNSRVLNALRSSLENRPDAPPDRAATLTAGVAHIRVSTEAETTAARARNQTLATQLAEGGVNSDAELQNLLQIEKSYAANARVLKAVDEMLTYLLAR